MPFDTHVTTDMVTTQATQSGTSFMQAAGSFLFSIASHAVYLFLTWLFWLAGTAALTHTLGGGLDCSSIPDFAHCNQLNSAMAFGWIMWILSTFALVVVGVIGGRSARRGDGFGGALIV
ncbi:MARVEL-like domain protein [Pseudohyphozyma bogoriensis]|nr:MARVEL-like domain protein [Pseudohyphozyma bogoriensis]